MLFLIGNGVLRSLDDDDDLTGIDGLAFAHFDGLDRARAGGFDGLFHLHGLDDDDRVPFGAFRLGDSG